MECVLLTTFAVFVAVALQGALRWSRRTVLQSLADEHEGWRFDGQELTGAVGAAAVSLRTSSSWSDPSWSVTVRAPWLDVKVERPPPNMPLHGGVETGDRRLDRAVCIDGGQKVAMRRAVLATLPPDARKAVRAAVACGFTYDGEVWRFRRGSFSRSRAELQRALFLGAELALRLHPPRDVDAQLEARLADEEDPEVRVELVRARLEGEGSMPPDVVEATLARHDAATLLLARHLPDGERWVREVMLHAEDEGTRWEALEALWARGEHQDVPRALATFLDSPWAETAIRRLALRGTVAEVPALRAVHAGWLHSRRAEADRAVEAIQVRARGERGQVSLAEEGGQGGGLAVY